MRPSRGGSSSCNGEIIPRFDPAVCAYLTLADEVASVRLPLKLSRKAVIPALTTTGNKPVGTPWRLAQGVIRLCFHRVARIGVTDLLPSVEGAIAKLRLVAGIIEERSVRVQKYLKRFVDRMWRNSKVAKSGYLRRCHSVDLHQFHLIPGDRRIWHHLRSPS